MTTKLVIPVPPVTSRTWKFIEDLPYTPEQIVAIVHRYCDAQDHAKNYRVNRAARVKAALEFMESHGESGEEEV